MRRIAVRAIIAKGNKLLLVKLKPCRDGKEKEYYCTVGGGLDDGEGIIDGLKREVLEETGIHATVGRLLFVQQYRDAMDNIEFFFEVTNADDFDTIDLSLASHGDEEIAEIGFYAPANIDVQPRFLQDIDANKLASMNETVLFNYL